MKIRVCIYLREVSAAKNLQQLIANTIFEDDHRASITAYLRRELLEEAFKQAEYQIDLLVLPADEEGLAIGAKVREYSRDCTIIYIDGSDETILRAFNTLPIAYTLRNAASEHFVDSLKKALSWIETGQSCFSYESRTEILQLPYGDIDFFESEYRIVHVHMTGNQTQTITAKLDDVQHSLPSGVFCRCHKSYLVNLSHIAHVDKSTKTVTLKSGKKLFASKAGYPELLRMLTGGELNEAI